MNEWTGYKREDAKKFIGKGWHALIDRLYDAKPEDVRVTDVKEKFGGLRFYVGAAPEEYDDLIIEAEEESYTICERCGKPGELRPGGWIYTLCDDCEADKKPYVQW